MFGQRVTMPAVRSDGSLLTVELAITPVSDKGKVLFAGWLRDITEIEKANAAVADTSALLTANLKNVSDIIMILRPDGSIDPARKSGHPIGS